MSHEHHHHHQRNENTETENYAAATDVVYGDDSSGYGNVPVVVETTEVVTTTANLDDGSIAETHKRTHKREEVVGGLGALAAGAFAMVIYMTNFSVPRSGLLAAVCAVVPPFRSICSALKGAECCCLSFWW